MEPWERQHEEPPLWYDRFEIYRLLGPGRSLDQVYRIVSGKSGRAGGAWTQAARAWRWTERAEAWDAKGWQAQSAAEEQRRRAARERRLLILAEARESALAAIRKANLRNLDPDDALNVLGQARLLLIHALRLERLEIGESEDVQEQTELGTPDDVEEMIKKIWGEEEDDG